MTATTESPIRCHPAPPQRLGTLPVTVQTPHGAATVTAYVYADAGGLAITELRRKSGEIIYTVTHLRSGRTVVPYTYDTLDEAASLLPYLAPLTDWNALTVRNGDETPEVRDVMVRVRNAELDHHLFCDELTDESLTEWRRTLAAR